MSLAGPVGLVAHGLEKIYPAGGDPLQALQGVSLEVAAGEFVCLVGPSGCGKSTLLKILAGLVRPEAGSLRFTGEARPRTALVFQEHGLYPWLTVLENVAFGLEAAGVGRGARLSQARALLAGIGLGEFARSYPHELSVGMRQRAAIARAFLVNPQLLLMDEPFSALDAQSKLVMQVELLRLWRRQGQTVVYVTHDIEEAILLGDRVLVMSGRPGRIKEEIEVPLGRPRDLRDRGREEVRELAWRIWKAIEVQVRQDLHIPA